MKSGARFELIRALVGDKASLRFMFGVIFGLGFSISVILGTVGIMDGFVVSLMDGLSRSEGDVMVWSRNGFFDPSEKVEKTLKENGSRAWSYVVRTEAFALVEGSSTGVLVMGVDPDRHFQTTGIRLNLKGDDVAIGSELANRIHAKAGDELILAFGEGNRSLQGMPSLKRFKVGQVVSHGVHEKDLRLIYMEKGRLQNLINAGNLINLVLVKAPDHDASEDNIKYIKRFSWEVQKSLEPPYRARPFWREFSALLEAVKVEKMIISLVLQLVVVISIFNVLAFVIYLHDKKGSDIFLFRALGLGQKGLQKSWYLMIGIVWVVACALSLVLIEIFDVALGSLDILKLPGDIYHLGRLKVILDVSDFALVFCLAGLWLFLLSWFSLRRTKKSSLLSGLRKEFS